jgi:myo-inositol-1-phosphate synthase
MSKVAGAERIKLAIAGLGNCASSLIEGVCYYRQHPGTTDGLLFPSLSGFSVQDIEVALAFDISNLKVDLPLNKAITNTLTTSFATKMLT